MKKKVKPLKTVRRMTRKLILPPLKAQDRTWFFESFGLAAARVDPVKRRHNRNIAQQHWRVLAECYRHELRGV